MVMWRVTTGLSNACSMCSTRLGDLRKASPETAYLQRLSRSFRGSRKLNIPCSEVSRGYKRSITSLGVSPVLYAFLRSLKSREHAAIAKICLFEQY